MKNQKHAVSKYGPRLDFLEPPRVIACTWKVQKTILANLRKAAHSRVDPARAGRSRELLEQLETKRVVADRHERLEPVVAAAPAPTLAAAPPAERAVPHSERQDRWPTCAVVKRCLTAVTGWAKRTWTAGLARG